MRTAAFHVCIGFVLVLAACGRSPQPGPSARGSAVPQDPAATQTETAPATPEPAPIGKGPAVAIAFDPGGERLAVGLSSGVATFETEGYRPIAFLETPDAVNCLAFAWSGQFLAAGLVNGDILVWDTGSGALTSTLKGHSDWVKLLAFRTGGERLVSIGADDTLRHWDYKNGVQVDSFDFVGKMSAISEDGIWMARTSALLGIMELDDVQVFSADNASQRLDWKDEGKGPFFPILSPDGSKLAAYSLDGRVRIWNSATGEQLARLDARGEGQATRFAFAHKQKWFVAGAEDGMLTLWVTPFDAAAFVAFPGSSGKYLDLRFSPDDQILAANGADGSVRLWKIQDLLEKNYEPLLVLPPQPGGEAVVLLRTPVTTPTPIVVPTKITEGIVKELCKRAMQQEPSGERASGWLWFVLGDYITTTDIQDHTAADPDDANTLVCIQYNFVDGQECRYPDGSARNLQRLDTTIGLVDIQTGRLLVKEMFPGQMLTSCPDVPSAEGNIKRFRARSADSKTMAAWIEANWAFEH